MNSKQENSISNAFSIVSFGVSNTTVLTGASTIYAAWMLRFLDILGLTETHDAEATENKTGYALQKKNHRTGVIEDLILISNAWVGHYESIDDLPRAKILRLNKSTLEGMRDARLFFKGGRAVKLNTPAIPGLADYNVDAAKIGSLNTKNTAYGDLLGQGEDQRKKASAYITTLKLDFQAIAAHLRKLDFIMESLRYSHPELYLNYRNVRKKTDNAATHGTPYATITIPAGGFLQGAMFPYLENRVYRVVNKSGEIIYWGLSNNTADFTGAKRLLGSKSSSICSSKTLEREGDILLFHNPTNNPVTVDIWVKEP